MSKNNGMYPRNKQNYDQDKQNIRSSDLQIIDDAEHRTDYHDGKGREYCQSDAAAIRQSIVEMKISKFLSLTFCSSRPTNQDNDFVAVLICHGVANWVVTLRIFKGGQTWMV